jgi:AcrR family transcriptional regulator
VTLVASSPKKAQWRADPLPRGRHNLGTEAVRTSQRERIAQAMLECVARDGYHATTLTQVVATARVSPNVFYEFFTDKTDCFLTVTTEAFDAILKELLKADREPTWIDALRVGTDRYLSWWQDRPTFATAYFRGLLAVGEPAREQLDRIYERFCAMYVGLAERARREQPDLEPMPKIVPRLLVNAILDMVAEEVRAGRGDRLTELRDELFPVTVKLLADSDTARAAITAR